MGSIAFADCRFYNRRVARFRHLFFLLTLFAGALVSSESRPEVSGVKPALPNFGALTHDGRFFELYAQKDVRFVVFVFHGLGCPIVQNVIPYLNQLKARYSGQAVRFYLVNSNAHDTRAEIGKAVAQTGLSAEVILDPSQLFAESLGVARTAEAVVVNTKGWKVEYQGALTDRFSYDADKGKERKEFLADAMDALLDGRAPSVARTEALGCLLGSPPAVAKELTFHQHIRPILEKKCAACHHATGADPRDMSAYEQVRGWAPMIREVLLNGRMPLAGPDSHIVKVKNDYSLSPEELRATVKWLDAGAAEGKAGKATARLRGLDPRPDLTLSEGAPKVIPADLADEPFVHFELARGLNKDHLISGVQVRFDHYEFVQHVALLVLDRPLEKIETPRVSVKASKAVMEGIFIPRFTRGAFRFPEGTAIRLKKGSHLVLEVHFRPRAKEIFFSPMVDFFFYRGKKPAKELQSLYSMKTRLDIPPGARNLELAGGTILVKTDAEIFSMVGHMHSRGRSMKVFAEAPGKPRMEIFSLPNYIKENRVHYLLDKPLPIKAGTMIRPYFTFDNSQFNPRNPDPTKYVGFGENEISDEMALFAVFAWRKGNKPIEVEAEWFARPVETRPQ